MQSPSPRLPGGPAHREYPAGVAAGAPLTRLEAKAALALVADDLAAAEVALRKLIMSDVAAVPVVGGYLVDAGGKRLRPALTALGARAVHEAPHPPLMCVGELIHLGSLLHDDVVDEATDRRGQPATHQVYGNAVSVLTGDFCLARAVLLASQEGGHRAVTALAAAVTEMAEGEVLQLQRAGDLSCSFDDYLEVVRRKSAALIAWCASAGALRADRLAEADALELYGRAVGTAFQITDDVLDYQPGTGKAPGADLRERKVTLPLLHAMDRIDGLRDRLQAGPPSPQQVDALVVEVRGSGALEAALADARTYVAEGIDALKVLPAGPGRESLETLGAFLVDRAS